MASTNVLTEKFEFAKRFAAEKALNQFANYLLKDPTKRVPQILTLAEKIAPLQVHKEMIKALHDRFDNDPLLRKRLEEVYVHPNVIQNTLINWVVGVALFGIPDRVRLIEEMGIHIPAFLLVDPTSACNLKCTGCWAGEYAKTDTIPFERMDRLCQEAKDLRIHWMVISGGEPFCYPHLIELAEKHKDMIFMVYTNGTLIDDEMADKLLEVGNITPAISLEGWRETTDARRGEGVYDKVMAAMDRLRERGIIFGSSVTVTRQNIDELYSEEFVDHLVEKGVAYQWGFHYIPVGRDVNLDLVITPEQRYYLAHRVTELRNRKPILLADFWNDGEATTGCIAGGRQYFHINAKGEVEPCAFVHFAVDNILEKSLLEVIQNPLFKAYQKRQPFNENHLAPCPMIDNPQILRDIIEESGAHPTHAGAEDVLNGDMAKFLDETSARWNELSRPIFDEREARRQAYKAKQAKA
jgi:MoaA/NifB/PqqE/SkfB family radical SAM enzyme